ncbi:Uncharacterised protein [Clostridioides difficile]|uniref:AbrB/MazE/SpoVT family DNA-binding domain-containing protein n=1 Tax=Clostridioides difficile TaxID=1496 RepID=UPI00097FEEDB|nr:AbrB/MazE/SpoVT family DNA-binding domain-containing protein [Clostridioides difficile]SJR33224.1 Uncharacterised protein [Clostridioides difficile]HBE8981826.1 hypothetical protein [Clostridioides difficile]HBF2510684.1 hypothetical protein [Clostridioides difficile]HBF2521948.1 hypothetical protein [Clostridioides difficile]HBF3458317.1 hypothetical protein [Clostridioides difficile]
MYEQRKVKVLFTTSGGTASKGSVTNRITIPTNWVKQMDITKLDREVTLTFDGEKIIIEKITE